MFNGLNAFIQAVKAADIKMKPQDGTFESPDLMWLNPLWFIFIFFAAKTQRFAVVLNKNEMLYPLVFDSTVLLRFHMVYSHCASHVG